VATALGDDGTFYNHGYALMELNGRQAHIAYYQDSDPVNAVWEEDV
jgi:hypothetical protein